MSPEYQSKHQTCTWLTCCCYCFNFTFTLYWTGLKYLSNYWYRFLITEPRHSIGLIVHCHHQSSQHFHFLHSSVIINHYHQTLCHILLTLFLSLKELKTGKTQKSEVRLLLQRKTEHFQSYFWNWQNWLAVNHAMPTWGPGSSSQSDLHHGHQHCLRA